MSKWKNKNFLKAFLNAFNGIRYTITTQNNIKIQLCITLIAIVLAIFLKLTIIEWGILVFTIFGVIVSELINTAIETTVDLYTEEYNEKAKIAKDIASGAVLMMAICSIIIGLLLFGPKTLIYLKF